MASPPETEREPTALPRWIAAIIIGAIAVASMAALLWPVLNRPAAATDAGVIRAQIEADGAAGRIGAPAPDFEWTDLDGRTLRLSSYRGKVVVVNFWATWCPPCREEMPALQRVAASEPDVVVLEVDLMEPADKARSFLDSLGLDRLQPVLDSDGATTRRFGVLSLPSTFFVDKSGVIRHLELTAMSEAQIRTGVQKAR
ncbi:MAG TPA: TlpA disulfide reductase family protein [Candidatus Bathyarchaeia archaeon]|nr:TlpA disulfide reductase family protein [Candidatus Bathyarchaeia archaeon]